MTSFTMIRPSLDDLPPVELPAGYALRTYRPGDDADWCRIMEGAIETGWTNERFQKEMVAPEVFDPAGLFFITLGDEPVATACAWRLPERYGNETGVLHMVAVRPEERGQRLGRVVSLAVLHFFRAQGLAGAVLHTSEERPAAVKTYLGLGFRPKLETGEVRAGWERVMAQLRAHPERSS